MRGFGEPATGEGGDVFLIRPGGGGEKDAAEVAMLLVRGFCTVAASLTVCRAAAAMAAVKCEKHEWGVKLVGCCRRESCGAWTGRVLVTVWCMDWVCACDSVVRGLGVCL